MNDDLALPIDPKLPVRDLLARHPHLASALAARGLDSCCGGEHPLADACRAKGVPLPEVLADLESILQEVRVEADAAGRLEDAESAREGTDALGEHERETEGIRRGRAYFAEVGGARRVGRIASCTRVARRHSWHRSRSIHHFTSPYGLRWCATFHPDVF